MKTDFFHDKRTALLYLGRTPKGVPPDVVKRAKEGLFQVNAATALDQLRIPPGNRLEALAGIRVGQYSIRVNDQWRICFKWRSGGAYRVEFCDYH
jgi:toxin HigB-1